MPQDVIKIIFIVIWLLIILSFIILELATNGIWAALTSISAIPSLIIALATKGVYWSIIAQILTFIVVWIIIYFSTYKLLKNRLYSTKIGVERIQGLTKSKPNILIEDSYEYGEDTQNYGKIKIDGKFYRTISVEGQGKIEKGNWVKVKFVKGNILYIEKTTQKEN
ncbi:NfeD family protein [Mycoplasma sp. 5370]